MYLFLIILIYTNSIILYALNSNFISYIFDGNVGMKLLIGCVLGMLYIWCTIKALKNKKTLLIMYLILYGIAIVFTVCMNKMSFSIIVEQGFLVLAMIISSFLLGELNYSTIKFLISKK